MNMKTKCKPGEILRDGFTRKAHMRKKYEKSNGKKIKAVKVKESYTKPTCVKDMGKPGKGKKIKYVYEQKKKKMA